MTGDQETTAASEPSLARLAEAETAGSPGARASIGLSPGQRDLSREFIVRHQRTRIVEALAEEVVANSYRDVTVSGIVRRAGVARNTFYDNFANKEECFLAASDHAAQEAMRRIAAAVAAAPDSWAWRVREGIATFLAFAASESALARVFIVESLSAGPRAAERYERTVRAIVPLLRLGRQQAVAARGLPRTLEETIVGGIFWIVYQRIAIDRAQELPELLPELVEFAISPYLGAEAARELAGEEG